MYNYFLFKMLWNIKFELYSIFTITTITYLVRHGLNFTYNILGFLNIYFKLCHRVLN